MLSTTPFSHLFGQSPFKPLQVHMHTVAACAAIIPDILAASAAGERAKIISLKNLITDLEHQADAIFQEIHGHLHKNLLLPVDRRDILEILEFQDDIADKALDIAGFFTLRPMVLPEAMAVPLELLARRCVDACQQAVGIQDVLKELMEVGFSGKPSQAALAMVEQLNAMESETDRMVEELLSQLFQYEDRMKPVDVVFWYQLIEWIGDLADLAEKVGDRLRLVLAR